MNKIAIAIAIFAIFSSSHIDMRAQTVSNPEIVATGFGKNHSTGEPKFNVIGDMLYASGPDGIMRRSNEDDAKWETFAMKGMNVVDFCLSGDDIVAVVVPEEFRNITGMCMRSVTRLVKGTVSGSSFKEVTPPGMGYPYNDYTLTYLSAMAQHPADENIIMALGGGGIYISKDFGETWGNPTVFHNNCHPFLGWHPQNPEIMFAASESILLSATVTRSTDGGETWDYYGPEPDSDGCCYCIAFDPNDENHLFLGCLWAIYESFDCGETWNISFDDEDSILGIAYKIMYDSSDESNSTIYSIGESDKSYPSFDRNVVRSTDNGKTWHSFMTYKYDRDYGRFFDTTIFDGKIWIYDAEDISYLRMDKGMNADFTPTTKSGKKEYYDLNGIKLNSIPSSGIIIEKSESGYKKLKISK